MKRKILYLSLLDILFILIVWNINLYFSLIIILVSFVLYSSAFVFLVVNKFYKKTNHWQNKFSFHKNFISNTGYRDNISRNFEIINLGSNPALFGFFYEKIRGQNWATGSQGLPMDFEILKYFHSYLKHGGVVLIPIMPFTAISQYIKTKPNYWSDDYYIKFASLLDSAQVKEFDRNKNYYRRLKYPLFYNPKNIKYLFHDIAPDKRLEVSSQSLSMLELEQDARIWIQGWMKEFDINSMEECYSKRFQQYYEESAKIMNEIIDFCLIRELKPVLITLPMSPALDNMFNDEFRKRMIIDFVTRVNKRNIPFLDYWNKHLFNDSSFYMNSFFFNLTGRKEFTNQVIQDLKDLEILD